MSSEFLSVRNLNVQFDIHQNKRFPWSPPQILHAVNDISFQLPAGKTLGIVGESGCGKSSLIRAIAGLNVPSEGSVWLDGEVIDYQSQNSIKAARRQMQMIFQDPVASLNPRMTIGEAVIEPLKILGIEGDHEAMRKNILDQVGISTQQINRYPHEFSGGQCQRIGIARALIIQPKLLLCDEPVSALDVSIQAQVVNLLKDLQAEMGLTMIFVAHDLGIVRHISDDIMVMYLGAMMEYGQANEVVSAPEHPYTQALLSAVPVPDPRVQFSPEFLEGELPSPLNLPQGCLFSTRCPRVFEQCHSARAPLENRNNRLVNCWLEKQEN